MPGLLKFKKNEAKVYFEAALTKVIHPVVREELKQKAIKKIDEIVCRKTRTGWLRVEHPGKHDPQKIRRIVDDLCHAANRSMTIKSAVTDQDFYCWTDQNRVCYHPFNVFFDGEKLTVKSKKCGYDVEMDLLLVMSYEEKLPPEPPKTLSKKPKTRAPRKNTRKSTKKK